MSRLYIIIVLSLFSTFSFSQQELKKYLEFAREKYLEGDYIYALEYYGKAMEIDSNSINTLWEYAETLRAYKDYPKAAFYYGKVYEREGGELYPSSLRPHGLMLKQCGRYDEALEVFKRARKRYRSNSRGYLARKSRQEIESTVWAKANAGDSLNFIFEALPEHINTPNAEFGHTVYNDKLHFSSLRADSISEKEEVYDPSYSTHLFFSEINEEGFNDEMKIDGVNWEEASTGNGTYSLDGKRFYFSYCKDEGYNYRCKILVAYVENNKYVDVDTLGDIINVPGANTTMPFIGEWDGGEVLFYASDREGGSGGMDIWYSFIRNGNQFTKPRNVRRINTLDDELSPFWDGENNTLYFSSSWHNGFGGQDVFKSVYDGQFGEPENLMEPINSPANDIYFFMTSTKDSAFVSSNRLGSNYSKNPTCCSDIFMVRKPIEIGPPPIEETLEDLNRRLPVALYFHNDIPNPRSWDTTSSVNYMDSYYDYIEMIDQYKKEYSRGLKNEKAEDAKDDIADFFIEYVQQGVRDLEQFRDLLLIELERGRKIEMLIKGFASPLAQTDYNVNLTKRRIASLVNYLKAYDGGVFRKYLEGTAENGGELRIIQIPFGEYQADHITSDNPNDVQNSVYSRAAAIERKIEIQSVDVIREEESIVLLNANQLIFDAGKQNEGTVIEHTFILRNNGDVVIEIEEDRIEVSQNIDFQLDSYRIEPNEISSLKVSFDTSGMKGHQVGEVKLKYNQLEVGLTVSIATFVE